MSVIEQLDAMLFTAIERLKMISCVVNLLPSKTSSGVTTVLDAGTLLNRLRLMPFS